MTYYSVHFKRSECVYCANIAIAENENDVKARYSKYEWVDIVPASAGEIKTAEKKGMPFIKCPHI